METYEGSKIKYILMLYRFENSVAAVACALFGVVISMAGGGLVYTLLGVLHFVPGDPYLNVAWMLGKTVG